MCLCCCYNICCCCNFCNSFSSRCIELTIFVFSLCTLTFSLLDIIIIQWNHLNSGSFILLILLIVFSSITTLASIVINIYRFRRVINKNRNSLCACLARIGLFFSIISFFISIISESIIQTNFKNIDYPCKKVDNNNSFFNFDERRMLISNDFCKDKGSEYYAGICSHLEYTISYLSSTINELCTLILVFLWYNDLKRIKEKVDGIYGTTYISQRRLKKINFANINEQQLNEIDSVNKQFNQFNQSQTIQNHIIIVKNNNKKRMSVPNLNYTKEKDQKNFIKNLREEMKEGIESINEEEDSSNKDSQNQKQDFKISMYKTNLRHDNINNNQMKSDITDSENKSKVEDTKENSIESPNIFL